MPTTVLLLHHPIQLTVQLYTLSIYFCSGPAGHCKSVGRSLRASSLGNLRQSCGGGGEGDVTGGRAPSAQGLRCVWEQPRSFSDTWDATPLPLRLFHLPIVLQALREQRFSLCQAAPTKQEWMASLMTLSGAVCAETYTCNSISICFWNHFTLGHLKCGAYNNMFRPR